MSKQQMADDIGKHFQRKLDLLISDIAEVAEIGDVHPRDFLTTVLAILMTETAYLCTVIEMDPHKFRQMCDLAYAQAVKNKAKRQRAGASS
jgi:hypothetical protein